MSFIIRVILNAIAFWLTGLILGAHFIVKHSEGAGSALLVFLGVALIFAIINAVVKPILQVLSLPLIILTLGLFALVVNALVLLAIEWMTRNQTWGLELDGFWWTVLAGLILAIFNGVLTAIIPSARVGAHH